MRKLLFKLPLLLLLGIISCTDEPIVHVDKFPAIYGTVVDVQGNPVAGAKVKVMFDIPQETTGGSGETDRWHLFTTPNPFDRFVEVGFVVNKSGNATLEIFRYPETEPIFTAFKNTQFYIGTNLVRFDANNPADSNEPLPNGFYLARLQIGDSVFTHKMFHQSSMTESGTWITTDSQGKFILDYKYFPQLGEIIPRVNDRGDFVGNIVLNDSVSLYIVKPNFGFTVQEMKINKTLIVEKTFIIK